MQSAHQKFSLKRKKITTKVFGKGGSVKIESPENRLLSLRVNNSAQTVRWFRAKKK